MDLNEIITTAERLEREATPGPWRMDVIDALPHSPGKYELQTDVFDFGWDGEEGIYLDNASDAAFIAFARTALPRLVAVARAAQRLDFDGAHCMNADIDHECYEFSPAEILPLRDALASGKEAPR